MMSWGAQEDTSSLQKCKQACQAKKTKLNYLISKQGTLISANIAKIVWLKLYCLSLNEVVLFLETLLFS